MQRILALVLTLAILLISVFGKSSVVEASNFVVVTETPIGVTPVPVATSVPLESGNYNGAVYAAANVLTWEVLQTFLYSVAGQQAYDTYANDKEAQEELYADYCDWWETTKKGTAMGFVGLVYMADGVTQGAMKLSTQASDVYSYYKTAGSSALQEMQDEAYKQWQVIKGGLKESGDSPQASPTPTLNKEATKIIGISGIGTLIGCVGGYIKDLVDGKRGEVSNKFNRAVTFPNDYFDGNYTIDEDGYVYFQVNGKLFHYVYKNSCQFRWKAASYADGSKKRNDRFALYVDMNEERHYNINEVTVYDGRLGFRYGNGSIAERGGGILERFGNGEWSHKSSSIDLSEEAMSKVSGIPVFDNYDLYIRYLETGDCNGAVNYFNAVQPPKPSTWLDYQMAAIAAQLPQILQALTTLPTITTESLTGFATAISAGINANLANMQAMTQAQLQQFMANLNTEAAKKVVTEELAEENPYEEEWDFENITPMPTLALDIIEKQNNGKMMVDLSKFFPFCVPYDMIRLVKVLNATPKAPKFETSIKYAALGINEKIVLDLAVFDNVAEIVRLCETLLFILALILVTRNLIRG